MESVRPLWLLSRMGRGARRPDAGAAALRALKVRSGVTIEALANACGFAHASGFQKYIEEDRRLPIPVHIVRSIEPLLVGKGSPPITKRELWEQVVNIPEPSDGVAPSNPKVLTAALQLAEAMGYKMKDPSTGVIIDSLSVLQKLGQPDFSVEEAIEALKRINSMIGQSR